jgi:sphinganine-1-phosphate aldolase
MEGELIQMTGRLFNHPNVFGVTTFGGTDSIFQALIAYRELSREKGITKPNIIVPVTVHAAFNKAGYYLDIDVIMIPIDKKTSQVDLQLVRKAINKNTICLVGSAPCFPHLVIDPIA